MSSTYAHYQGPSSIPADYAILSALNNDSDSDPESGSDTDTISGRRLSHRKSFPHAYYYRPAHPTIGLYPEQQLSDSSGQLSARLVTPSETTPLLSNPPIPRIEEQTDSNDYRAENKLTLCMFWEEFRILAKYSLPVFGYCLFLPDVSGSHTFAEHTFLNILSSSSLSYL